MTKAIKEQELKKERETLEKQIELLSKASLAPGIDEHTLCDLTHAMCEACGMLNIHLVGPFVETED